MESWYVSSKISLPPSGSNFDLPLLTIHLQVSGRTDYLEDGCLATYPQGDAGETCSGAINTIPYSVTLAPTAPTPSSAPTSAPTFPEGHVFGVSEGGEFCSVSDEGLCVGDIEGNYGNNERCTIQILRETTINLVDFKLEAGYDHLRVCTGSSCTSYSGTEGPAGVTLVPGQEIRFETDHSIIDIGWTVCDSSWDGDGNGDGDLRPDPAAAFAVLEGYLNCATSDGSLCIHDTDGDYGNSEMCSIGVLRDIPALDVRAFSLESGFDFLHVCPVGHVGTDVSACQEFTADGEGLSDVSLVQGQIIRFTSDSSIAGEGFHICATTDDGGEDRVTPPPQCVENCRRGNRPMQTIS